MSRSLGIPVKLMHEATGHVVTVELKSGELYRGTMIECEDNWNCQLDSITFTAKVTSRFYIFSLLGLRVCNLRFALLLYVTNLFVFKLGFCHLGTFCQNFDFDFDFGVT